MKQEAGGYRSPLRRESDGHEDEAEPNAYHFATSTVSPIPRRCIGVVVCKARSPYIDSSPGPVPNLSKCLLPSAQMIIQHRPGRGSRVFTRRLQSFSRRRAVVAAAVGL